MSATRSLSFRCHCGALHTSFPTVPSEYFPLKVTNCHCWTSRSVSGNMSTANIVVSNIPETIIPNPPIPFSPALSSYKTSADTAVTRYFCSTCGAHAMSIANEGGGQQTRKIALGLLEGEIEQGMLEWDGHMWLSDLHDGGIADKWVQHSGKTGGEMKRWWTWAGEGEQVPYPYPKNAQLQEQKPKSIPQEAEGVSMDGDRLEAKCRCGGVHFYIPRPPPDPNTAEVEPEEAQKHFWHKDGKYLTQACVCYHCRHASGYPVTNWTFISNEHGTLTLPDGSPVPESLIFGTMKRYDSSPDVERYFCGECGAKVFYRQRKIEWGFMDVATGLLAREGQESRREDWLMWGKNLSFPESGEDQGLVEVLKKGFA